MDFMTFNCRMGIVVIPRIHRGHLGYECIKALKQFITINSDLTKPLEIYFDQEMFHSIDKAGKFIESLNFVDCKFYLEQNSKDIKGIQLADLSAHVKSIQLKTAMGLLKKIVKPINNLGYEPDIEVDIGFEMRVSLRYWFFNEKYKESMDSIDDFYFTVEPYGLYVSDLCDKNLADVARKTFSKVYLGCIY